MKLIIQIPCYNEEETLPLTIADLPRQIDGIDTVEYLIIDDGSSDGTIDAARENGVHHIVGFKANKGLAYAFQAGIDACLRLGADIIVNTDADNQYCGEDIEKLVAPILAGQSDIVIGERPIYETEHFSPLKKRLQRAGSFVVRICSGTKVPDAPSGFRAYSREAALRLNVVNNYTYTLETIIQAGMDRMAITSVPIRTNPETRKSRLFKSIAAYIRRSMSVILRSYVMYRPLRFFLTFGSVFITVGLLLDIRYIILKFIMDSEKSHIPSVVLSAIFLIIGVQCVITGVLSDIVATNRKLLEDIQYRIRRAETAFQAEERAAKADASAMETDAKAEREENRL